MRLPPSHRLPALPPSTPGGTAPPLPLPLPSPLPLPHLSALLALAGDPARLAADAMLDRQLAEQIASAVAAHGCAGFGAVRARLPRSVTHAQVRPPAGRGGAGLEGGGGWVAGLGRRRLPAVLCLLCVCAAAVTARHHSAGDGTDGVRQAGAAAAAGPSPPGDLPLALPPSP